MGRDNELVTLETLYERVVREGSPHLVSLIGEAGVGKTRLLREFERVLGEHSIAPTVRTGRCLPYGSGIVFWALGEVLRAECAIVDSDSAEEAWRKLSTYVAGLFGDGSELNEPGEREAALIGRLLGIEVPPELVPSERDPERLREAFFSALRMGMEKMASRRPLVLAFEDIHWADDGMLDAIEHLAQWVRAPLMLVCLARDELLDRRPGWGAGRRSATQLLLDPLASEYTHELVAALIPGGDDVVSKVVERSGGNPLFAEEMARRVAEGNLGAAELPDTVQAVLAARLDALDPFERRLVQQAAVVGRTFWEASLAPLAEAEGRELGRALTVLQEKDILAPGAEGRLAGERELAFKHVLIRDVAYGMLPKAVRSRKHFEVGAFIEERAGDRTDEMVALLAEHYGRAASLGREGAIAASELAPMRERAMRFLEEAGDAAALLYSNREAAAHYRHARDVGADQDLAVRVRVSEKLGDVSLRLGRVDEAIGVWQECLDWHRGQEDLERVADLHRKTGAALSHKGERRSAIEHYQRGINLLKDGPPRIELVRLYEEAAWLYLHTGDNMLAIYASEKALRLAERLGETRAASRAHGIFGRVFGRIGDTEKARQNLERAVELARGSDDGESILALSALGRHLEISEADMDGAREAYHEALALAERVGHAARAGGAARLARAAVRLLRRVGRRGALHRRQRRAGRARGPRGQALPPLLAARAPALARGPARGGHRALPSGARAGGAGGLVRDRVPGALRAGAGPARLRRLRQRRRCARPRDRRLRARRPARAVDPGHRRPRRGPVALPAPRAGPRGRPRGRRAGRADALPDRPRRGPGGARALRRGPRGGRGPARRRRDHLARARPPARGRPLRAHGRPAAGGRAAGPGPRAARGRRRRDRAPRRAAPGQAGAGTRAGSQLRSLPRVCLRRARRGPARSRRRHPLDSTAG